MVHFWHGKNTAAGLFIYNFRHLVGLTGMGPVFVLRKQIEKSGLALDKIFHDNKTNPGLIAYTRLFGFCCTTSWTNYRDIYRYSRINALKRTFVTSPHWLFDFVFAVLSDDITTTQNGFFTSFIKLFVIHFSFTTLFRMIILTWANKRLKSGKVSFTTHHHRGDKMRLICTKKSPANLIRWGTTCWVYRLQRQFQNHLEKYLPKKVKLPTFLKSSKEGWRKLL